jgi:hypothetical protein
MAGRCLERGASASEPVPYAKAWLRRHLVGCPNKKGCSSKAGKRVSLRRGARQRDSGARSTRRLALGRRWRAPVVLDVSVTLPANAALEFRVRGSA